MKTFAVTGIATFLLIGTLSTMSLSPASGQETGQPESPPSPSPAEETPLSEDEVTNERIKVLDQTGLIARQSEISESMLLMDLQLRQAEMIAKLLSVLGPDAEIEIAPGEFRRFSDSPAALRERIALLELQSRLAERLEELDQESAQENVVTAAVAETTPAPQGGARNFFAEASVFANATVVEIFGEVGSLRAILELDGQVIEVRANDTLPGGEIVANVRRNGVGIFDRFGNLRTLEIRR